MAHLCAACQTELAFLSPPYKIPVHLHPPHGTGGGPAPYLLGPVPQAGAWILHPVRSHRTQAPGAPQGWGAAGAPASLPPPGAGDSLAPNPPATPPPHIFMARTPKTPRTPTQVMPAGLGHLVLLEVGLHGNAVLRVQCPEQGQPQDAEQCGVHVHR